MCAYSRVTLARHAGFRFRFPFFFGFWVSGFGFRVSGMAHIRQSRPDSGLVFQTKVESGTSQSKSGTSVNSGK